MKKIGKIGSVVLSLVLCAAMICGCGGASYGGASKSEELSYNNTAQTPDESAKAGTAEQNTNNRKIIEYINLTVETKTFDKLIDDITAAVKQSGGYIESSEIGGNSYYGEDNRTAQLRIRIPKTNQSGFSEFMSKNSNVVNRSVSTDDVTDSYIDTQSRIKALTLEKETLEKLITQSSTITETMSVYERLTNVIAEIEAYQGKLNQMDNLIDYTTFTVYIDEVEKETNVEKQNWFKKTWNDLSDNFSDVGKGLLNCLSFVIAALPYWILFGIIAVVIILVVRRIKKRRNK